jgi:single-stranded-DNA-specific exonuclease
VPELNPTPSHPQPAAAIAPGVPGTDQVGGNLPRQRWDQPAANPRLAGQLAKVTGLSPLLTQVLINRGLTTPEQAADFLEPERLQLPPPLEEFPDLGVSLELLVNAIETQQAIAICGDYDADGMTSTALLLRALRLLGGKVDYTIPSRMAEGYGINTRIVEDCYGDGVSLILTVDNGIAARDPIARARELGLAVIVTDHHDLPPELPPANAILNPKLLPETSPYRGVAGVGVAYILAVCLAQLLDKTQDLTGPLLELFTLGTIADLAPLTGVNRRWVRRGLGLLPRSRLFGIQALIQVAGLADQSKPLKPEHIGFRLGPRINAVGRISDPQVVIDLLTTDDVGVALERAMQCEQINATRQELCQTIEQEAIAWCEYQQHHGHLDLGQQRVLVVVQPGWHHGVIGIVASRLVERYGVPVFIGTYEDDDQTVIRGSARGIPEFDVFEALQSCHDLLEKFGGHRAAGGFSFLAKHLRQVTMRLSNYACQTLQAEWLKPLVKIDVQARLEELNQALYDQIDHLHPCGIENPDPVFWTPQVQVLEQQIVGRNRDHLKLVVAQGSSPMKAIAWRWGAYYPLPDCVDIAYKLKQNEWQGVTTVELELVGVRLPNGGELPPVPTPALKPPPPPIPPFGQEPSAVLGVATPAEPAEAVYAAPVAPQPSAPELPTNPANFSYKQRRYWSSLAADTGQLTISNPENQRLVVVLEDDQGSVQGDQGTLYLPDQAPRPVDVSDSHYAKLIQAGRHAIEIQRLTQQLEAQARQPKR